MNGRFNYSFTMAIAFGIGFLIAPTLVEQVWGEKGKNYDIEQIDEISFRWTSSPDRIHDGAEWKNYVYSVTDDYIRFESSGISFEFYKNTCDFKLYDRGYIGKKAPTIDSFSHFLTIDGTPEPLPACGSSYSINQDGMQIIADRGIFKTIYDLSYSAGVEWTHEVDNNKGKQANIFITDTCLNCNAQQIDEQLFLINDHIFNTKNDVHGTVFDTRNDKGNFIIEYQQSIRDKEKLVIDPTFSTTTVNGDDRIDDNSASNSCDDTGGVYVVTNDIYLQSATWDLNAATLDCGRSWTQFDTTGIPNDVTFISGDLDVEIDTLYTTDDHRLYLVTSEDLTTRTGAQKFDEIDDDTLLQTQEINAAGEFVWTFDAGDLNAMKNEHDASGYLQFGFRMDDETQQAGTHTGVLMDSSTGATPPELTIEYSVVPNLDLTQTVGNIGDTFRISGIIDSTAASGNITSIIVRHNGTIINTNNTDHNQTSPYTIKFGAIWERETTDQTNNFTTTVTFQGSDWVTYANETKTLIKREYDPTYKTAVTSSLGKYNYTIDRSTDQDDITIKSNRINVPVGDTWDLNCRLQTAGQALIINGTDGTWLNETDVGYYNSSDSGWANDNLYGTCFNTDNPVFSFQSYTNGSLIALGITGLDDLYGGFIGVPVGILFVAFFAYMATPKTAPTYTIFVVALLALVAAAGFVTVTDNTWGLIIIGAAVGLLVKKLL